MADDGSWVWPGLHVHENAAVPVGEAHFVQDGKVVGKIVGIGAPPAPVAVQPAPVVTDAQIDEREAFENYLRGRFGQDAGWFLWRAGPDGCYVYMQSEWEAWQARAILAAHPTQESEHG